MKRILSVLAVLAAGLAATAAAAQEAWIQIEARPSRAAAEARAAEWDTRLDDVAGFSTGGRWYAVALGPYTEDAARARLLQLRGQGLVPPDSFVSDGAAFGAQIYAGARGPAVPGAEIAAPTAEPEPLVPAGETLAQARAAERRLTGEERRELQQALAYDGYYNAAIDGAFGPGTRRAIEAWQRANRFGATGFLTTSQRAGLLGGYRDDIASLGMSRVTDTRAGVEIDLPLALLGAPVYEPPFARYEADDGSGAMVLLISQSGDQTTLAGLYDIMQTLEIVPMEGLRERRRNSFVLTGANGEITSHSFALTDGETVKGFTLVWPADDMQRRSLVLSALQESFRPVEGVLPDVVGGDTQSIDLLAGLEIRRPGKSRSGFYVSGSGAVVTTTEAVGACERITLGEDTDADIAAEDAASGLALLTPRTDLAPLAVARLSPDRPRLQSEIAVAGYSFGGALGAPTLTFGSLADVRGLDGDSRTDRLALSAEPGDAGGPVFDTSGAVVGMLRPRETGGARLLPGDVSFATDATVIAEFLSGAGISAAAADAGGAMAPEDLTLLAADMTVLVSCWN